jgi:maltose O-acetyltransferase
VIEDGVHIGGASSLAGLVTVAEGAILELNVVVGRARRVGAGSIVGSMSLVLHDIPDGVVAHGIPARVVRRLDAPAGE